MSTQRKIKDEQLKQLIEAALFVNPKPLSVKQIKERLLDEFSVSVKRIKQTIEALEIDYRGRGIELVEVASGYRFQTIDAISPLLAGLWPERAPKYSRAMLETLALIAYKQPITRAEIEEVRGVAVGTQIMRSLIERQWVKIVGHREVPGRPAIYATTRAFLDHFKLKSLDELPELNNVVALYPNRVDDSIDTLTDENQLNE